jgi:hypothetical protein
LFKGYCLCLDSENLVQFLVGKINVRSAAII